MEITKEGQGDNTMLVVKIPMNQKVNNCYDEDSLAMTDNLVGVIAGDDLTISQLIDLSYKGDQQEGMPIVHFDGSKEEFVELCASLGIQIIEHSLCSICGKVIYGSCTWGNGGSVCFNCEKDGLNKEDCFSNDYEQELSEDLTREQFFDDGINTF